MTDTYTTFVLAKLSCSNPPWLFVSRQRSCTVYDLYNSVNRLTAFVTEQGFLLNLQYRFTVEQFAVPSVPDSFGPCPKLYVYMINPSSFYGHQL